jgi:hypothetical protein
MMYFILNNIVKSVETFFLRSYEYILNYIRLFFRILGRLIHFYYYNKIALVYKFKFKFKLTLK